ncbi:type III pantothenate kinase, partial [Hominenteromicrobium sp.]|uniref:type III pantothenate kinase n=1 Tax=Hominenteromicrobium sp. TaxID=3073581 RepID=UPI003A945A7A
GIHHYPLPQIIIDMGTATTVSVLDAEGGYRGGFSVSQYRISCPCLRWRDWAHFSSFVLLSG